MSIICCVKLGKKPRIKPIQVDNFDVMITNNHTQIMFLFKIINHEIKYITINNYQSLEDLHSLDKNTINFNNYFLKSQSQLLELNLEIVNRYIMVYDRDNLMVEVNQQANISKQEIENIKQKYTNITGDDFFEQ